MKDLFTVCITHYNQMKYIFTAIDSVLSQDYSNIELIVSDDASKFNKEKVERYINSNKKSNIKNVIVITREQNVGTVKNVNNVIKNASGKYIMFFAADDALSNTKVISNYVKAFNEYKQEVITAQACLYDSELNKNNGPYVDVKKALNYNNMLPKQVFYYMAQSCFYASGATAYKLDVFKKYGLFDEKYLLVEDWSYYLHLLKNNVPIYFVDFKALNHRDGGVSHNTKITPTVKKYYEDILKIYEQELLNDMPKISNIKKLDIYHKCEWDFNYICDMIKSPKKEYYLDLIKKSEEKYIGGKFAMFMVSLPNKIKWFFKLHVFYKFRYLNRDYHILIISMLYYLLINSLFLKDIYANSQNKEQPIILLLSMIVSCMSANLFVGIGDLMEYSIPLTLIVMYRHSLLNNNIFKVTILFFIIYIIVYYVLFILRIIYQKFKEYLKEELK